MKSSIFSPLNTSGQAGGSVLLDRILSLAKRAMDALANAQISNLAENGGVWTVTAGPASPAGNPPAGQFYVYVDRIDGKWKSRGSNGTVTILGSP